MEALWKAGLPSAGLGAGTVGARQVGLPSAQGGPLRPLPARPPPARVALRGARRGWARSRASPPPGRRTRQLRGAGGASAAACNLEQGGWQVSGCQWAGIFMRLQEVLPVCSSLSFHLSFPVLPLPSSLLYPGGGHPGSGWRGPASAGFEIWTTAHLVLGDGWEGQTALGC